MEKCTKKMDREAKSNETFLTGASGSPGIVMGRASIYERRRPSISLSPVEDTQIQEQLDEFQRALATAERELKEILDNQEDQSTAELVYTQIEMLKDPELNSRIENEIVQRNKPADAAIKKVFDGYLSVIEQNHAGAAQDHTVDISDVRDRLIQILHNYEADKIAEDTILVARELSSREVIEFSEHKIKGIIMDSGAENSHAAIIARSMKIPTILGSKNATSEIAPDDLVILDGVSGQAIVNPGGETQQKYKKMMNQQADEIRNAEDMCRKPNETKDGISFCLRANIEFAAEVETLNKFQAEGVGLLRTESIYLRGKGFGNQQDQETFYRSILRDTAPHPVVIRLFDAGGDKFFDRNEKEQNPFLGWRGIRMLLDKKDLLKQQLLAICKTAADYKGRVRILIPMITTTGQLQEVRDMLYRVQTELKDKQTSPDEEIPLGIMVEVPNVAMQTDLFAEQADFLSIGTNDLAQYLLAVDRGNSRIANLYDQRHPMMWRLIKGVVDAASAFDKPVSVCGELAADPVSACCLMGLGIRELSMNPAMLPEVKKMLRSHTETEMEGLADEVMNCRTMSDIERTFANWKTLK